RRSTRSPTPSVRTATCPAPPRTRARRRPRRTSRVAFQQAVGHHLRPRLHAEVVDPHLFERQQLAGQLGGLTDRDVGRVAIDQEHHAQVHLRDRRRLIVEQAEQLRLEASLVDDLLLPLTLEAVMNRIATLPIAWADVLTDTKRQ